MLAELVYKCGVCKATKGQANRWLVGGIFRSMVALMPWHLADLQEENLTALCSDSCALKWQSRELDKLRMRSEAIEANRLSLTPTPYRTICPDHGGQFLTVDEYDRQMDDPNRGWRCPLCRHPSDWDDFNYDEYMS